MDLDPKPQPVASNTTMDWPGLLLLCLLIGWCGGLTLLAHGLTWTLEQSFLIEALPWPWWAWPLVGLGLGSLTLAPSWLLGAFWPRPRYKAAFQTIAMSSTLSFFALPVRLLPANKGMVAGLLQTLGSLLFAALVAGVVLLSRKRGGSGFARPTGPYLPALAAAPLLSVGWLLWGALGSFADTAVNLTAGLSLGLGFGLMFGHLLLGPLQRTSPGVKRDIILGGLVAGTSLFLMSAALGYNGQQILLALSLTGLGVPLTALCMLRRQDPKGGWLAAALLCGLIAAAPMLFMDPDELIWILNLGSRDVLQWGLNAGALSLAAAAALSLVLWLIAGPARVPPKRRTGLWIALCAIAWGAGLTAFLGVGQPGLYGDRLYVVMQNQADLAGAADIADYPERRAFVYHTLVDHANTDQASVRKLLDRLGIAYTAYYLENALEVHAGPLLGVWLDSRNDTARVLHSPELRPLPALPPTSQGIDAAPSGIPWNIVNVQAERVWAEFGVTGQDIVVAQSDSGAQWEHPELAPTYRGGSSGNHDYAWFDPWYDTPQPVDMGGHGTHTLATAVGQNVGIAPGATWYACANLPRNLGNPARYLDCMQFVLAPFPIGGNPLTDGDPARGAHVANNSWGCPEVEGCDPQALVHAARALRAAGVFVVASAGNEGDTCESVASPIALYDEVFSVGAVDGSGRLAFFSSRGPVSADGSGRTKPDILAPGVDVLSAYPGGTYEAASGTSMAGPHLVGVVALMWSANPALIGDIDRTEQILIQTARPYDYARHGLPNCAGNGSYPNNAVGYGIVDAYAAVEQALAVRGP